MTSHVDFLAFFFQDPSLTLLWRSYSSFSQGINLQQAHSAGQLVYINAIAAPYDWTDAVTTETSSSAAAAIQSISNAHPISLQTTATGANQDAPMEALYRAIERQVKPEDDRAVCVVLDNLSALTSIVSEDNVNIFVQYVRSLALEHGPSSCVVALAHSDIDSRLVTALSHAADLVLKVEGFKTGYSNEEDGQVCRLASPLHSLVHIQSLTKPSALNPPSLRLALVYYPQLTELQIYSTSSADIQALRNISGFPSRPQMMQIWLD